MSESLPVSGARLRIFHLCARAVATPALAAGTYQPDSLAREGFIHLSQAHQVRPVADAFFAGQHDLVVLVIDPARLRAPLRYEAPAHPPRSGGAPVPDARQRFPHLYGPLNADAVLAVLALEAFEPADFDGPPDPV